MPPNVVVTLVPSEISPGDTAAIIVRQRDPDGNIIDFPPDKLFEVEICNGDSYGTIMSLGDTADYFESVPGGFEFIAADSIDADSAMVGIQVGPGVVYPSSTVPGGKGTGEREALQSQSRAARVRVSSAGSSAASANLRE